MIRGDGLHDLAARCVKTYADELPGLLEQVLWGSGALPVGDMQKSTGRLWLASEWRPEHLIPIYETWEDRIVDAVLDGVLTGRVPALTSALRSGQRL